MKKLLGITLGTIGLISAGISLYSKGRKDQLEEMSKEIEMINGKYVINQNEKTKRTRKNTSKNKAEENKSE